MPCVCKYVDDSTIYEICHKENTSVIQQSADTAVQWSQDNDMMINGNKTKEMLMCFCKEPNHHYDLQAITVDGKDIERVDHVKLLGVTVSSNLTWNMHVDNLTAKAGKMLYRLYQLKRAGLSKEDRTRIYLRVVRPTPCTPEYACPVWHTGLPKYLADGLEMIQKRALRSIYPGYHYEDILRVTGLQTLAQRRDQLCQECFNKLKKDSHRVHHLLPPPRDPGYEVRSQTKYPKIKARTEDFYPMGFVQLPVTFYQGPSNSIQIKVMQCIYRRLCECVLDVVLCYLF